MEFAEIAREKSFSDSMMAERVRGVTEAPRRSPLHGARRLNEPSRAHGANLWSTTSNLPPGLRVSVSAMGLVGEGPNLGQ